MTYFVRGRQPLLTWLPEQRRRTLCLMQSAKHCRVRGYLGQGIRPHINLYGVRYSSAVLACSPKLIGRSLLVYLNADDLRCVRAFLADGSELGVLEAQGAWRVVPLNLKLRQEILKLRGKQHTRAVHGANPVEAYVQGKLGAARKSRKVASELAQAVRTLASAPTVRTPPGPVSNVTPPTAAVPLAPAVVATETTPAPAARPRKLSVGTGQVF